METVAAAGGRPSYLHGQRITGAAPATGLPGHLRGGDRECLRGVV